MLGCLSNYAFHLIQLFKIKLFTNIHKPNQIVFCANYVRSICIRNPEQISGPYRIRFICAYMPDVVVMKMPVAWCEPGSTINAFRHAAFEVFVSSLGALSSSLELSHCCTRWVCLQGDIWGPFSNWMQLFFRASVHQHLHMLGFWWIPGPIVIVVCNHLTMRNFNSSLTKNAFRLRSCMSNYFQLFYAEFTCWT